MADVFISYKKEERATAKLVIVALEAAGYSTWWDDDLTPRTSWDAEIEREIKTAKAVVVLWSPLAAVETSFVRKEAGYALDHKKLVPAWIAHCDLPLRFRDIQTADLTCWDRGDATHTEWRRALSWIAPLVGRQPKGSSPPPTPQAVPLAPPKAAPLPDFAFPEMVRIPPGRFLMGSEGKQHEVGIAYAFEMGKYQVTVEQWDAALQAGAQLRGSRDMGWGRDRQPATGIFWEDTKAYTAFLNDKRGLSGRADRYRLPSEAEWEYACRAGTTTIYSTGDEMTHKQARFGTKSTVPVGSFPANAFGLHDMHGNVREWCEDPWHDTYNGAPNDGSVWTKDGDTSQHVLRGGSYDQGLHQISSYARMGYGPWGDYRVGFRVARTPI